MAGYAVLVALITGRQQILQRLGRTVMEIGRAAVDTEQRRRIEFGAHFFASVISARADIVKVIRLLQAAVGEVGTAVALSTADLFVEEELFAPLRGLGEFARSGN